MKCGEDEEKEDGEEQNEVSAADDSTTTTTDSAAPAATDQFVHTPEFRRHFVEFVPVDALMVLRLAMKGWNAAVDALIDEVVRSGELMVHDGKDINKCHALITQVVFLLNITKVGRNLCLSAYNLVFVDIPEGVESIGERAFNDCRSLTTISFPTTLTSIGDYAFSNCSSLENVDLLHTNLKKLGTAAFRFCTELKSVTIPDSLQTQGENVFFGCYNLVLSNIYVGDTNAVVAHLRSKQQQ
ncbi:hypothetical protein TrLO_g8671 [Triparma laevis f. longispina]|uniref:Uncharacterized protein n=1 Tax=Triparma laevis f. longispina TaxID=1714387 RepID=A0A9W6ZB81_9STRA|nr:hypothetical protein TrLO_g8671 [Triparma laevis f. longispina]